MPVECPPPKKVEVAVRQPIDKDLISDCAVKPELPMDGPLHFKDVEDYTIAIETALECARGKLRKLREAESVRSS